MPTKPRSEDQIERQRHRTHADGKYARVNPCYVCGKSAGASYYSDPRTDTGDFGDIALVLCPGCFDKGEALDDAAALAFYQAGKRWQ